jgi:hypothetical protein
MVGCTATARLYPVQGPLALQSPLPVFAGKLDGSANSGNVSFVMADGEVCKGRWTRVIPERAPKSTTAAVSPASANTPATSNMSSVWDVVYGSGYYVAHVLGDRYYGQGVITGDRGTVVNVEFYHANGPSTHVAGVARDSKGNIYKMVFTNLGAT